MSQNEIQLPENLQNSERAGFDIIRKFLLDNFGESYITRCVLTCRCEFTKIGVLAWQPTDANTVIDVSPMPPPWAGQWGYRIRFCALLPDGSAHVNQFYVPQSTIPAFRKGDLSAIN